MVGNQRKMEHESTASTPWYSAPVASLPSKFVVFSPNGEMEKGASASALALHHEMKLVGITIWLPGPDSCIHSKPLVIQPNGGNADL